MGRALGDLQKRIGLLLLDAKKAYDFSEIGKFIYRDLELTKSRQNVIWRSLNGMDNRGMIHRANKSLRGATRWELTKQGRADMETLRPSKPTIVK